MAAASFNDRKGRSSKLVYSKPGRNLGPATRVTQKTPYDRPDQRKRPTTDESDGFSISKIKSSITNALSSLWGGRKNQQTQNHQEQQPTQSDLDLRPHFVGETP